MVAGIDAARRPPFARIPVRRPILIAFLALLLALGLTSARVQAQGSCFPAATHLCLNGDRFQVDVDWMYPGAAGKGQAVPLTADSGLFWFFGNSNLELIVKVLDGRPVNGHFWVYHGGLSDVDYQITVTDTETGAREIYANPAGRLASGSDTEAFAPEPPASIPSSGRTGGSGEPSPLLRLGDELQVNVTTKGLQTDPAVAVGADGGSMVVWTGDSTPIAYEDLNVYGRFYDQTGAPRGGEIQLNAASPGTQLGARVAASPAGKFMAVWNDGSLVTARLYAADGQPLGGEIRVGSAAGGKGQPAIVGDPAGGFLVGWPDYHGGTSTMGLQRFNDQGNPVGNEISLPWGGYSVGLAASPVPGGGFLISWTESAGTLETDLRALRLDAAARPLTSQSSWVNFDSVRHPGDQVGPVPVFHADGGFSLVWKNFVYPDEPGTTGLFARRYAANGEPLGGVVELRGRMGSLQALAPAAVALPSGATLVLWYEDDRNEDRDGGTFGRLYDPSWQPLGGDFRVNTYTQAYQYAPAVATDAAGDILAAWQSGVDLPWINIPEQEKEGQDGSYFGVYAQRFTTASCALDSTQLCLDGRFRVAVRFTDPRSATTGTARPVSLTSDTGGFWFFDPSNAELMIKVLDGRAVNGHFWVFFGALSDVEYTITVTDTLTAKSRTYHNAPHQLASRSDIEAF